MEKSRYIKQPVPSYKTGFHDEARRVPLRIMLSVIFNNIYGYMGLSFAGMGMLFALIFTPMIDFSSPFHFGDSSLKTTGAVSQVEKTNMSVNEETVIRYEFTFTYMGRSYSGTSYSTEHSYRPDDSVPVEFEPSDPSICRIEGMGMKPAGMFLLFIYIFPLIGFVFLYFAFKKGIQKIHAIRYGIMTRGKFVKMESTGGSINDRSIYDLHFAFKDRLGNEYTAIGSTHLIEQVQDEPEERIIYDPDNPGNSVVVDAMPSSVRKFLSSVPG